MSGERWLIPPSVLKILARVPGDVPVAILLRHSVRERLAANDVGPALPITDAGRRLAVELGEHMRGRLRTLHSSPLLRCMQTAEALAEGAAVSVEIIKDRLLGDPGAFVIDDRLAWTNWQGRGNEGVARHLTTSEAALPGMAKPDEAVRFLVQCMLGAAAGKPGVHVFVTHDLLVAPTAARFLGRPFDEKEWPWYLEGAFFWSGKTGVHAAYRDCEILRPGPLCTFAEGDLIEFARREIGLTVGLDSGAHFFLAGGAFKSLITGLPPRDLNLWAASARDRELLCTALLAHGARRVEPTPFADAFEISGRRLEISFKVEPGTLRERLRCFDIGLSAVGVEHLPDGRWTALVDSLAIESVRRQQVLLVNPVVNWEYALVTLERMRRYAHELGFVIQPEDELTLWRLFESRPNEIRRGMVENYQRMGRGGFGVIEEIKLRSPLA